MNPVGTRWRSNRQAGTRNVLMDCNLFPYSTAVAFAATLKFIFRGRKNSTMLTLIQRYSTVTVYMGWLRLEKQMYSLAHWTPSAAGHTRHLQIRTTDAEQISPDDREVNTYG